MAIDASNGFPVVSPSSFSQPSNRLGPVQSAMPNTVHVQKLLKENIEKKVFKDAAYT